MFASLSKNQGGTTDIIRPCVSDYAGIFIFTEVCMNEKIISLMGEINAKVSEISDLVELDKIRVAYLGKKGSITALLKGMKDLSPDEKKAFGSEVNQLKAMASEKIEQKIEELKKKEVEREIASMRPFDITAPSNIVKGSYHPITLVQRQCEAIFKSMGFTVEDYSEIVTDYECFESLNIPKHHPARDMQDTYYLDNGQLLKSQTSAAQNAILKKYGKNLIETGVPIKACQSNEVKKSIITNFNADFTASKGDFSAGGSITANDGQTELVFNKPQTVDGLKIGNDGGEISIEIDDLTSTADEAYLPNDNLLQLIHCVATEICDGREILYQKNNESDTYILETSKGKCTYSVDKNGYILSAQINSKNFRIDFSNQYELG